MEPQAEIFMPDEQVVFRGRPMRVAGRVQFEGSSGQLTFRYFLADEAGAPGGWDDYDDFLFNGIG